MKRRYHRTRYQPTGAFTQFFFFLSNFQREKNETFGKH